MTDDEDGISAQVPGSSPTAEALALGGASRDKADAYLDEQLRFARLQSQNLIEQNAFELSHLRWRRFNDQMKGALQIMVVALGLLIVVGIAAAMWNASQADGLVVDSFVVSPQLAASGISGDMIADGITNKLIVIRTIANAGSVGVSQNVQQDRGNDIKVEIPDTGISVAEAWRYLRSWLGHERHLRGSVRMVDGKTITLTLNGADVASFTGSPSDLDKLEQNAAEHVFASTDGAQYVIYLSTGNRGAEALAVAARIAQGAKDNRADLYALWSQELSGAGDNDRRGLAMAKFAETLDPRVATPHLEVGFAERALGHDEAVLRESLAVLALKDSDQPAYERGLGFSQMRDIAAVGHDQTIADFNRLLTEGASFQAQASWLAQTADAAARLHDAARARRLIAEALLAGTPDAEKLASARYFSDVTARDWRAATNDARQYAAAIKTQERGMGELLTRTQVMPLLATALAKGGDTAGARVTIGPTPLDCYPCLRARGMIEGSATNWTGAASWFERAVQAAPSIPFAYADWGEMLLRKGDFDGAIAKFTLANRKGSHFADPLEMWGEALIAKNHSDLALTKFAEAEKYAPNWGRLHLKWGEALSYTGDHIGAQKQFRIAAKLDLTPSEKLAVEHWIKHG